MAIITGAVLGTMIFTQVKAAVLDEIFNEKKPDYVSLINKLDKKLDQIILTVNDIQKKQYMTDVQTNFKSFFKVAHSIVEQVNGLPTEEEAQPDDKERYNIVAGNIDRNQGELTELKFELLGGKGALPEIPEHECLPQKYRDYLIFRKHGNSGIPLFDFIGSSFILMRSGLESIIALKILYTRACRISGRTMRPKTLKDINDLAEALINRMISGRETTFLLHHNIFKLRENLKCNLEQVAGGKALDGVHDRTYMSAETSRITITNDFPPIPGVGTLHYDPPVYLLYPPTPAGAHMIWHLCPTADGNNIHIKHMDGSRVLGWFGYGFWTRREPASATSTGEPGHCGDHYVVSVENLDVVRAKNIEKGALWDFVLTGMDERVHFRVKDHGMVLRGNSDISVEHMKQHEPQLHVNHPTDMHAARRHWKIHNIEYYK